MNIYTLHKEGLFRPPEDSDSDSNPDDIRSTIKRRNRMLLPTVTEENKHGSSPRTSDTSGTGTVSSSGEKTPPRRNRSRRSSRSSNNGSRVDATRAIETKKRNEQSQKTTKTKTKKDTTNNTLMNHYSDRTSSPTGTTISNLFMIQANDEFVVFEDDTDLVSHITIPVAVRTSPLEGEYLVIDHDEFAVEDDLVSTITVPKPLRKKKSKKHKKISSSSKAKKSKSNTTTNCSSSKQKQRSKKKQNSRQRGEGKSEAITEENENEKDDIGQIYEEKPIPLPLPTFHRQNSLELGKNSGHSNSSSSRKTELKRGRRRSKETDQGQSLVYAGKSPATISNEKSITDKSPKHAPSKEKERQRSNPNITLVEDKYDNDKQDHKKNEPQMIKLYEDDNSMTSSILASLLVRQNDDGNKAQQTQQENSSNSSRDDNKTTSRPGVVKTSTRSFVTTNEYSLYDDNDTNDNIDVNVFVEKDKVVPDVSDSTGEPDGILEMPLDSHKKKKWWPTTSKFRSQKKKPHAQTMRPVERFFRT